MNPGQTAPKGADQTAVFVLLRFACWAIIYDFLGCLFVFKIDFFAQKKSSGILSECQTV